jgi:hypothetical protein
MGVTTMLQLIVVPGLMDVSGEMVLVTKDVEGVVVVALVLVLGKRDLLVVSLCVAIHVIPVVDVLVVVVQ